MANIKIDGLTDEQQTLLDAANTANATELTDGKKSAINNALKLLGHDGKDLATVVKDQDAATQTQKEKDEKALLKKGEYDKVIATKDSEYATAIIQEKDKAEKYRQQLIRSKLETVIVMEATKQGAVDPQDIIMNLNSNITISDTDDTYKIVDDNNQEMNTADAVKTILEKKPHLKKSDFTPSNIDENQNQGKGKGDQGGEQGKGDGKASHTSFVEETSRLNAKYRGNTRDPKYLEEYNKIKEKHSQVKMK